jgi:hypothetical protein
MSRCPVRALLLALLTGAAVLAGCGAGGDPGSAAPTSRPAAASPEPAAAAAEAAAEAAADPAAAGSPDQAALAIALRTTDVPAGWRVQANPLAPGARLADNPSLNGICGYSATSEAHRTAKHPVVGLDGTGTVQVSAESIAYDTAAAAATAVQEVVHAFSSCPPDQYSFEPGPGAEGLAATSVVFQYQLAGGATQVVLVQGRGQVLSVLIGEDPATTAAAARSIATRIAALPAAAIGA